MNKFGEPNVWFECESHPLLPKKTSVNVANFENQLRKLFLSSCFAAQPVKTAM
jgi:hypothetical protein